jgi:hypothetical protein
MAPRVLHEYLRVPKLLVPCTLLEIYMRPKFAASNIKQTVSKPCLVQISTKSFYLEDIVVAEITTRELS